MAVYGIGATFEKKDVLGTFIKDKIVFLSRTGKEEDQFSVLELNMDKYNVRNIAIYEEFNEVILAKVLSKIFAVTKS